MSIKKHYTKILIYNHPMADDLSSLIRVRKHAVEQKQKVVAELYRQAELLQNEKTALLGRLEEEQGKASEMGVEMLSYFGPYAEAVQERVEEIDKKAVTLEARIQIAQDDMRGAFAELKKVEITQESREKAEIKAQNKKESDELDEIAIEAFRRGQEDG